MRATAHPANDAATSIAVIGGGLSGACAALHAARAARGRTDIHVFDPRDVIGRGVAYSAPFDFLVMNVPAGRLSVLPDSPRDFLAWCRDRGRAATEGSFVPRRWFGEYVESRLASAVRERGGLVRFAHVRESAVRIERVGAGAEVAGDGGSVHRVDHVVLAPGPGGVRVPNAVGPFVAHPHVLASPWHAESMRRVAESSSRVLIAGTGLTMCDAAVTLERLGFRGEIIAVSKRGLAPRAHGPSDTAPHAAWARDLAPGSLAALVREVRGRCRGDAAGADGWRGVIDSMRPHVKRLWAGLSPHDRHRFTARVAALWDVHRHRCPPAIAAVLAEQGSRGVLRVARGRLAGVAREQGRFRCTIESGASARGSVDADAIILCCGPEADPRRWGCAAVNSLLAAGEATIDSPAIGLRCDGDGRLIGADGAARRWVTAIGPLRRGGEWECTAVPEIVLHATSFARSLGRSTEFITQPALTNQHTSSR